MMSRSESRASRRFLGFVWVGAIFAVLCGGSKAALAQSEITLLASDGALYDAMGKSVAISGDYAVLGAPNDSSPIASNVGSAYVFRKNGSTWIQQAKLVAFDGAAYDHFGTSVAIDGIYIVVGTPNDADKGVNSGSAYVFKRNDNGTPTNPSDDFWEQKQKLSPPGGAANDSFGISVGISGVVIIVGASQGNPSSGYGNGAAYIYRFDGATWIEEWKLLATDGAYGDRFGWSVAVSGAVALVGAYLDQDALLGTGSAYVFVRSGSTWVQQQKLQPSGVPPYTQFGTSVALYGDLAAIGDPFDDDRGTNVGSVSVFRFNGFTWIKETELYGSDSTSNERFGASVAAGDNVVVIGAYNEGNSAEPNMDGYGAAYKFRKNGATWIEEQKLVASVGARLDAFGQSVVLSGSVVVVGSPGDSQNAYNAGAGFVFAPCVVNADCDDGLFCNGAEICDPVTGCKAGTAPNCADSITCTTDTCDEATDACKHTPNNSLCNDGKACTDDSCNPSTGCVYTNNDTNTCSDGNACTTGDHCSAGSCVGGAAANCDDGNACTTDACVPATGCTHVNVLNGAACGSTASTDCDNPDTCNNGTCVPNYDTSGTLCTDDGNACTNDICNGAGSCTHPNKANGTACGSTANTDCDNPDTCNNGTCVPNYDPIGTLCTDDGNICTNDICNGAGSCTHPNKANGTACGSTATTDCDNPDTCNNGACAANYDPSGTLCTDDGNTATSDTCNGSGMCQHVLTTCPDDGNPCTNDVLSGGLCTHPNKANGTACGSTATTDCDNPDTCNNGACVPNYDPSGTLCTDDGNACTNDTCNGTGSCSHPNKANGTACGSTATTDCDNPDTCNNGTCAANYDPSGTLCTDDGNACTNDICNGTGSCTHPNKTNGTSCSDGNVCNGAETCQNGACAPGIALNCNDSNACTTNTCVPATGCTHSNVVNGTACGSQINTDCDNPDTCNNGTCVPNYDPSGTLCTDDGNACTNDICNGTGSCTHPNKTNGTSCRDGDVCNGTETCQNGACAPGTALTCNDSDACTTDSCDPATGCVFTPITCTVGQTCVSGVCTTTTCQPSGDKCTANSQCCSNSCKGRRGAMKCK
jgi:hypothetical protein